MPIDDMSVRCGKCNLALNEDLDIQPDQRVPCPSCGSASRKFEVTIHDSVMIKSKLGMKAKHQSGKKPFIEQVAGDDLQRKTGKWIKLTRVIDRENNLYKEIFTDPKTGEVIYKCIEPLSNHKGHGSAKYKKSPSVSINSILDLLHYGFSDVLLVG